ncbi:tRNA pseudouridine(55) synthase TruB [Microgenomates group bacterium RIFCSPLOWO2_01_FULL_47_10]|nr:MAG: tRNA pseudouridine(55) synthase TruB [Microgenomates group bacterium RIFCSPLOWO2_01_FULL_47_10]
MIISVIKPVGPTSFDVVARVRYLTKIKKVGHAGTLDPLASGVLVIAIGKESTTQISSLMLTEKEYVAEITLGANSTTDDSEGEKTQLSNYPIPQLTIIKQILTSFLGEIQQIPPLYSAIKVGGKRAYKSARKGQQVMLSPRSVIIKRISLISYSWPKLRIKVTCEKGVYIRSLARDIGKKLGTGGYISALDRTRVGNYTYKSSISMADLEVKLPEIMKKLPQV